MTWWFTTFMAPAIKQKVHSLPGVEYLYAAMSPSELEIPAFITEHDMTVSYSFRYIFGTNSITIFSDKWNTILSTWSSNITQTFQLK